MEILKKIKQIVDEKNKQVLEQEAKKKDFEDKLVLEKMKEVFLDVLKGMPKQYNVSNVISKISIRLDLIQEGQNQVILRIPKQNALNALPPADKVAFLNELQERLECLNLDAARAWQDFWYQYDLERAVISERCLNVGNDKELKEYDSKKMINRNQLYSDLQLKFWKYIIFRIEDNKNDLYIKVYFSFQIRN